MIRPYLGRLADKLQQSNREVYSRDDRVPDPIEVNPANAPLPKRYYRAIDRRYWIVALVAGATIWGVVIVLLVR